MCVPLKNVWTDESDQSSPLTRQEIKSSFLQFMKNEMFYPFVPGDTVKSNNIQIWGHVR